MMYQNAHSKFCCVVVQTSVSIETDTKNLAIFTYTLVATRNNYVSGNRIIPSANSFVFRNRVSTWREFSLKPGNVLAIRNDEKALNCCRME